MSRNHKLATIAALGLLLLTILSAPWQKVTRSNGHVRSTETVYRFILAPPDSSGGTETRLATAPLLAAWGFLGLCYVAVLRLLPPGGEPPKTPTEDKLTFYRYGFWFLFALLAIGGYCKWFYY